MKYKTLSAINQIDEETGYRLRHVKSETECFRPHDHDYYELFLVLGGRATHIAGDLRLRVSPGDLIFIRKHDVHDYTEYDKFGFEFLNFAFTEEIFLGVTNYLACDETKTRLIAEEAPPIRHLSEFEMQKLHMKLAALLSESDKKDSKRTTHARRLIADIFDDYFITDDKDGEPVPFWLKNAYEKMKQPKNFLNGTSRFFELCGKTREHTTRLTAKYYKVTPTEYITSLRLSYAAGLIKISNLSINEICYQSGFNNVSYFYMCFKEKFGTTPKNYRKLL